jgi:predicted phage tail protein
MENANLTKELAPFKATISKAEAAATALQIKTVDELTGATELLGKIKTVGKAITQKKESITKPLNEALKNIRDFFRPVETQWANAEQIVKGKMIDYQNDQLAKAAKETKKVEEKVEAGKMTFEKAAEKIEAVTPQKNVTTDAGAAQFRTVKEVVIDNETLIPREYLVLDLVKIRKVALAGVNIPGVRVVEKQAVAGIIQK